MKLNSMEVQNNEKKIPWHRNIKWYHLWMMSIASFSSYFLLIYIYDSEYFIFDILGILSLIFAIIETIKSLLHIKNKEKVKQKTKTVFLIFCVYVLTAYIISLFQEDDYGDTPLITGMFLSVFATPIIVYLWNKYTKDKKNKNSEF